MGNLNISDQTIKALSLIEIVNQLHKGSLDQLIDAGLTAYQLEEIRSLKLQDLTSLVALGTLKVTLSVDADSLADGIVRLRRDIQHRTNLEYWICNGATPEILKRYFTVSDPDIRKLRQILGATPLPGRRPVPSYEDQAKVAADWQTIKQVEFDYRTAIVELHKKNPRISIDILVGLVETSSFSPHSVYQK